MQKFSASELRAFHFKFLYTSYAVSQCAATAYPKKVHCSSIESEIMSIIVHEADQPAIGLPQFTVRRRASAGH